MFQLPILSTGFTKTQLAIAASNSVDNLLNNGNITEAAEMISAMETYIKEMKGDKRYIDYLRSEVEKSGKSYTSGSGTKIELAEVGTKYDYSRCEDSKLVDFTNALTEAETALKARQEFLKTLPLSGMNIITDDGEAVTIYPPSKTSTSSYKVTLAK